MSSYDPRGWGHSPKELVALSHRQIWLAYAIRTATLGADFSAVLLPRLLTPRRGNLRVEWMLSHFYECFSVILLR